MKIVEVIETIKNDETIIKEKVEVKDKDKLTLVNILNEINETKRQNLIKKKV